jgi:hypothetical protein
VSLGAQILIENFEILNFNLTKFQPWGDFLGGVRELTPKK